MIATENAALVGIAFGCIFFIIGLVTGYKDGFDAGYREAKKSERRKGERRV